MVGTTKGRIRKDIHLLLSTTPFSLPFIVMISRIFLALFVKVAQKSPLSSLLSLYPEEEEELN